MELVLKQLPVFLLVFLRLTAFFAAAPAFSARGVPNAFKIAFSFLLALVAFAYVPVRTTVPMDAVFVTYALKEVLVGLTLAFVAHLFFYALQVAGGLIDMQMGFALANVIDPHTGAYVPISGNFKHILAVLYFFSINGHHMMIRGLIASYQAVPADRLWVPLEGEPVFWLIAKVFAYMFSSAFMIAAPIVVALFLVDLSLGIIAKSVPQFHIFVVGLPIKIIAGFLVLFVVLPGFFTVLSGLFDKMFAAMADLMKLLGGVG